jgi:chromosome segregation ATPase
LVWQAVRKRKEEEGMGLETITGTLQEQKAKIQKILAKMEEFIAKANTRLAEEEEKVKVTRAARHQSVQRLTALSAKERDRADREIDDLDAELRSGERLVESLRLERDPVVAETAKLRARLTEIDTQIDAEARAKAKQAAYARFQQVVSRARHDCDVVRTSLAKMVLLERNLGTEFGEEGFQFARTAVADLLRDQENIGTRGFERVDANNLEIRVWPAIRKEDLP